MKTDTFGLRISYRDPNEMSVEDRRAELSRILVAGYRRLLGQKAKNGLASLAPESADVNNTESDKEVA